MQTTEERNNNQNQYLHSEEKFATKETGTPTEKKEGKRKQKPLQNHIPGFVIEDIADLKVHRPIRTDKHVARGSIHQRAGHRRSPPKTQTIGRT